MGEIKELEEARRKIDQIILRCKAGEMTRENARKQILNLKGDGWKIAIVGNWSYTNPDGDKYAQVIWQAGE